MVAFENERKKERERKEKAKADAQEAKKRDLAMNFQTAEVIRQQEKSLKQAHYFNKELRSMQAKESKANKIAAE